MVCFVSSLPTPHPLTQFTLTGLSHSFAHVKSSLCIKSGPGLVCVHHGLLHPISPHHLIHSPIPPQQVSDSALLTSSPHLASILGMVGFVPIFIQHLVH